MTANNLTKTLSATVRPVVCFALVAAFIYSVVSGLTPETIAAVAGPMGMVLGFYFRARDAKSDA